MDDLLRWLPVVILVTQVLMGWGLWSLGQKFITREMCASMRKDCGSGKDAADKETSDKVSTLKSGVDALPSRSEFVDLSKSIGRLSEKIGNLDGRLGGINRAVDLLNQHHLRTDL